MLFGGYIHVGIGHPGKTLAGEWAKRDRQVETWLAHRARKRVECPCAICVLARKEHWAKWGDWSGLEK